ncbi:hypothetical protein J4E93_002520 [Alternaria ventricosa]|uniref:uncharacterized protein n=1 Tax=Alternaria ventricosa TaxID=1187951 RepID=UPI0020C415B6|nr:uncharacterized protein J4E93_002520 [Alternaria ventricosa]KAI4652320.1 hypothetical protein J4E93_002520 [Alternaria ventricosa]
MASHGKVMDLFDERYLELQDVVGNVEPLPTLVPYEQYKAHAITYRMDTNHDVFFALLQDFTERKALETDKELWTWCVQWEVSQSAARQSLAAPQSAKRPRLDLDQPNTPTAQKPASNAPPMTLHARCIDPDLLHEEDMLRILVDIVQVDSTVVPNFIEFLYRWIDFYEGDGKALKAALHGEIPSLWDFEYHPFLVPQEVKKEMNQATGVAKDGGKDGQGGDTTTQMRQKPDLAALERKTEESERLKYREVHFGIQPPKTDEPLPPLINIPRDQYKRAKYYEACFKSRQRAFFLLVEAGVTPQNMRDYQRDQTMSLQETPPLVDAGGLKNYEKDAKLAQAFKSLKERHRAKQLEISISNKLADEAQFAARSAAPQSPSGVPLIPTTTSHAHRPNVTDSLLRKIQQTKDEGLQRINIVPTPLVGKMKSTLFRGARDKAGLSEMFARSNFPSNPRSSGNFDGGRPNKNNDGDGSTDEDSDDGMSVPRARMRRSDHAPPPAFAQRLVAAQETQGHTASYGQRLPNAGLPEPRAPDLPSLSRPVDQGGSIQQRRQLPLNSLLAPPQTTMQRTAPSPLNLRPPGSPLSSFAPSLLATSPFTTSHRGIPIQIYLPKIVVPANTIGPGGLKLGDNGVAETDAFLLGYTHPKSGKITLNRAVFLPLGVWANAQDRVRKGHYNVLESYAAPDGRPSVPHRAAYEKAKQAYEMMMVESPVVRERELTKRWRASRGRMTATQRGAVWEGWALEIDREIALDKADRRGAFVQNALVDGVDENSDEARRRREIEELLETDEAWDYEEDENDEDEDGVEQEYGDEMEEDNSDDDSDNGDSDDEDDHEEDEEDGEDEDVHMEG